MEERYPTLTIAEETVFNMPEKNMWLSVILHAKHDVGKEGRNGYRKSSLKYLRGEAGELKNTCDLMDISPDKLIRRYGGSL